MVTIETLEYIYTAYKCGSYQEAADMLSVTHSVVAKQVARGEAELGVRLFERASKAKAMRLSPAGEALIGQIEGILCAYDEMRQTVQALGGQDQRTLHIGYGYYVPCEEELSVMSSFKRRYPNVVVSQRQYSPEEQAKLLSIGKLDGGFVATVNDETLGSRLISRYPPDRFNWDLVSTNNGFHFLMSPDDPLARRPYLSLEDRDEILEHTILITSTCRGVQRPVPSELGSYLGISQHEMRTEAIDSSNFPLLSFTLREGGYLYPTGRRVTRDIAGIVAVPIRDWPYTGRLFFVSRKNESNAPLHNFRQCARELAEQEQKNDVT